MARYYGKIGFVFGSIETRPGIWQEDKAERNYYGDTLKRRLSWEKSSETINDTIKIANQISIIADEYAEKNFYAMKWAEWKGLKWEVTSAEVERPRIILTLGGVYKDTNKSGGKLT